MENYTISTEEFQKEVLTTVTWSPFGLMDRFVIHSRVPAEAGIYQLWVRESRGFSLLTTRKAFYGGLRAVLREIIDEMAPPGQSIRNLISGREAWFRFSLCSSRDLMEKIYQWYAGENPGEEQVFEVETLKRFRKPPQEIIKETSLRLKDAAYGPPLTKRRS